MVIGIDDALILAAVATAASGAAAYQGQQDTNKANQQMSWQAQQFQGEQAKSQHAYNIDMMRETNERARYDAEVGRAWQNEQAAIARNFNSAEAGISRDWAANQADITRGWNANQAQISRDWAANMSNTAYQRSMSDMRAAGLNPILAYSQGGAGTPQPAMATSGAPSGSTASATPAGGVNTPAAQALGAGTFGSPGIPRMENALGPAVSSAVQAGNTVMSLRQVAAQTDQVAAQTNLTNAAEAQSRSQTALNAAQTVSEAERANLIGRQAASEAIMPSLRTAQASAASAQATHDRARAETEAERPSLTREQARREGAVANLERERWEQLRRYGSGSISGITSGVGQPVQDILRSIGEYLR